MEVHHDSEREDFLDRSRLSMEIYLSLPFDGLRGFRSLIILMSSRAPPKHRRTHPHNQLASVANDRSDRNPYLHQDTTLLQRLSDLEDTVRRRFLSKIIDSRFGCAVVLPMQIQSPTDTRLRTSIAETHRLSTKCNLVKACIVQDWFQLWLVV